MIQDSFVELCVKRDNKKYRITFAVAASIALLLIIVVINVLPIAMGHNIIYFTGLISFGLIYLLYRIIRNMNMEYEIEISNDTFDVARIIARRKREDLASFSVKDCDYIGPVTADRFGNDRNVSEFVLNVTPDTNLKISDENWYALVNQSGDKYMIVFTFKDEMYPVFKRYNPRNTASYTPSTTDEM